MSQVIAVIQARMGSNRLPGKMSKNLGGYALIEWVIYRLKKSKLLTGIILATTTNKEDSYLLDVAIKNDIDSYVGSQDDVLTRFVEATKLKSNVACIVRVCADNPFVDPDQIDELILNFNNEYDYGFNHLDRWGSGHADGFGAEIISHACLGEINKIAHLPRHREHVTKFIIESPELFKIKIMKSAPDLAYSKLRFDVDTNEDLVNLNKLCQMGIHFDSSAAEIIKSKLLLQRDI